MSKFLYVFEDSFASGKVDGRLHGNHFIHGDKKNHLEALIFKLQEKNDLLAQKAQKDNKDYPRFIFVNAEIHRLDAENKTIDDSFGHKSLISHILVHFQDSFCAMLTV